VIPAYNPSLAFLALVETLAKMPFKGLVIINDGSAAACTPIFDQAGQIPGVTVLRHAINLGKGQALKTAFNYLLLEHEDMHGVVTADADGQHLPEDILKVAQALDREDRALVLGVRTFNKDVPLRSRFGNILTAGIARCLLGGKIQDTQTGLRGINRALLPELIRLRASGYEYEMEMLVRLLDDKVKLIQVDITTVYIGKNEDSHFNPIRDSLTIYYVFLRHISNSIMTAILDFFVFSVCYYFSNALLLSFFVGRIFGGSFNFFVGKTFVFKSKRGMAKEALSFSGLVIILMALSYCAVTVLMSLSALSPYAAKIIVETVIFILSFAAQRLIVFSSDDCF
jgi:glycosyltransferase involved in cell wall biosynthesis